MAKYLARTRPQCGDYLLWHCSWPACAQRKTRPRVGSCTRYGYHITGRLFADAMKGGAEMDLAKCQKCNNGLLIPLSDYWLDGASVMFKAWACTNPDCGFSLRVDKGEVTYGKRIEPKH